MIKVCRRYFIFSIFSVFSTSCGPINRNELNILRPIPVNIVGVQHIGENYSIPAFYINKYSGGAIGRKGGGGGYTCCTTLPSKWRPGLTVEVRWEVADWTNEIRSEIVKQNYSSIKTEGIYIAQVTVEKYEEIGNLYVHFFPGGRVRVVTSMFSISNSEHPVRPDRDDNDLTAAVGKRNAVMFTADELDDFK